MSYCEIHSRTRNAAGECLACELEKAAAPTENEAAAFWFACVVLICAAASGIMLTLGLGLGWFQ